jgi:pimeloyl-ACP methyl ester carboxylesterase
MSDTSPPSTLTRADGGALAYRHEARDPGRPGVVFLPGFRSDMSGEKATRCAEWCAMAGVSCLRLDYSGHGRSDGDFADGTVGRWADDATLLVDQVARGPQILVGSSMGGWIMDLVALRRPDRVVALIGIAAAPDFTEDLIWNELSDGERAAIERNGRLTRPSAYDAEPDVYTLDLIEDGRRHLVLRQPIGFRGPVRLLHGQADEVVPWRAALRHAGAHLSDDVRVVLVKDGDHRLSRPQDLTLLADVLAETVATVGARSPDGAQA